MATWKRSLAVRPNRNLQASVDKAEREMSAEAAFDQQDTGHFTFHYEGRQSSDALRHEIMRTLEGHYNTLVSELGVAPRQTIPVSLYTEQAY